MIYGFAAMLFVGLSLGIMGGGGSILTVPILVYLFSIPPAIATGYSLFIVGVVSCVGVVRFFQQGEINFLKGASFAIPGLAGIWLSRAVVIPSLPEEIIRLSFFIVTKDILIMLVFACLMIVASVSMIKGRKEFKNKESNFFVLAILGFLVSVVTGFVGAGGGFLIVPCLNLLGGLRMKQAVATSLFVITINSLFGFGTDVLSSAYNIDWMLLLSSVLVAVLGLFIGIQFTQKISERKLKKSFGVFVFVAGSLILIQQAIAG